MVPNDTRKDEGGEGGGVEADVRGGRALKDSSKGKPFFGGDTVGLVDITLGSLIAWMKATEVLTGAKIFDPAKTPLLAAWTERFAELDTTKKVLPDVAGYVEYVNKRRQTQAATAAVVASNS
jgi:glutathione S-transferase